MVMDMDPRIEAVVETLFYLRKWVKNNIVDADSRKKILNEINDILEDIETGTYEDFRYKLRLI